MKRVFRSLLEWTLVIAVVLAFLHWRGSNKSQWNNGTAEAPQEVDDGVLHGGGSLRDD